MRRQTIALAFSDMIWRPMIWLIYRNISHDIEPEQRHRLRDSSS